MPGNFTVKGGQHICDSGASGNAELGTLPSVTATVVPPGNTLLTNFDEQIVYKDPHGENIAGLPFTVNNKVNTQQKLVDTVPAEGALQRLNTKQAESLEYALRYAKFKFK